MQSYDCIVWLYCFLVKMRSIILLETVIPRGTNIIPHVQDCKPVPIRYKISRNKLFLDIPDGFYF